MTVLPLPVVTKVTNSICVQRLAVERFLDMHHSYKNMKILMVGSVPFGVFV